MKRIEKFKTLLKERIADYQKRYDETKDRLIFGALQEAKDTLDYIEKTFPDAGNFHLLGPGYEVSGYAKEVTPGEFARTAKFGICIERRDGTIQHEEVEMEEDKARVIEGFHQALVKYYDRLIDIHRYEENGCKYIRGTMHIVKVGEIL